MEVFIRQTTETEFHQTEHITREAFWNLYKPGCDEHLVLHNLRKSESYIPKLDILAEYQDEIIGHCISTLAHVIDDKNDTYEVLCVGPISVLPPSQKHGIGSQLMRHTIAVAKNLEYAGMILFGDPAYYHRFGFRNAAEFGIQTKDGKNFEAFMGLELQENGFANIQGKFHEDKAFEVDEKELAEFEKRFPRREKSAPRKPIK